MMQQPMNNYNDYIQDRILVVLLMLACILSNLSQLPYFVTAGITQTLNMPIWIIVMVYLLIKRGLRISTGMAKTFGILILSFLGMLILTLATDNDYFNSSLLNCLILSLFIYTIGEFSGKAVSDEGIRRIVLSYAISALVVATAIYVEYFSSGLNLASRVYAYSSKNSVSQIIFTSIVIFVFIRFEKGKIFNILRLIAIAFEVLLLFVLRSRATIVGFLICLLFIVGGKQFNRRIKRFLLLLIGVAAIALFFSDSFSNTVFNNILFAGRDVSNLNSLTSGRVSILSSFPDKIRGNWLTGIGRTYYECFPLSCVLQYGLVIGLLLMVISYLPIFKSLKCERTSSYANVFLVICTGYFVNSIFEGLAPIGPGVKCYFMWLVFGIFSAQNRFNRRSAHDIMDADIE